MSLLAASVNVEALVIFAFVLGLTLAITYWASKKMTGADSFFAAGRSITAFQNGLAISGDYLSAASFLGIAGLIFIFGFDGFLYSVGFLVAFVTVMFLLAERMGNAGKYTIADVLSFRLDERPARTAGGRRDPDGRGVLPHRAEHEDAREQHRDLARIAAAAIGAIAIAIAIVGGEGLNVSFMVGLAFAVAASANFPALLLALTWRRLNTAGAVTGVLFGVVSSIFLVIISPKVWPGPDAQGGLLSFYDLANPGIISIPLGFLGCWLGTVLGNDEESERSFDELYVRSETGLGAEGSLLAPTRVPHRAPAAL